MGLEIVIRARDNYSISVYIKSDEVQEDSIVTDGTKTGFHFSIKEESDTEYTYVGYTEAECISDGEGGWYTDEYLYTYSGLYPGKTYNLAIQIDGSVASYEVYGKATTTSSQTQTWVYSSKSLGTNISKICSKELPFDDKPYRIYRCPVSFAGSGKAVFYSEGKLDVIGYLTTENDIERLLWYGSPSEYIEISGVNNTNFYITCDVVKGIQYYLIVRTFSGEELGTTTVYAEPPTAVAVSPWSWYSSNGPYTAEEEENLTNKAHNALSEKMSVSDFLNFSYLVWNDLCEKVGQMLVAAGGSWKDTAGAEIDVSELLMPYVNDDKTLYASKYNLLQWQIYRVAIQYGLASDLDWTNAIVSEQQEVDGIKHFIGLTELLNLVIDYINTH
ncbi:MAG: hypothetical protein IJA60_02580 [Clostridia bacterium]|nr:hypothetical protein [Clostridia bacterium]